MNPIYEAVKRAAKDEWHQTIGSAMCQECKHGKMFNDQSYRNDDCDVTWSFDCPAVEDLLDNAMHSVEVSLIEREWVNGSKK